MSNLPGIAELECEGKRVLLRLDLNLPMKKGEVTDATRLDAALPTIEALREKGARVIVCSHLGRPKGQKVPSLSLMPVASLLAERLGDAEVFFSHATVGDDVEFLSRELPAGGVMVLENLRFHGEEKSNNLEFAGKLARLADVYVNDAFGVLHRGHASVKGIVEKVETAAVGPLIGRELEQLDKLRVKPQRPYVAILGGAKISDKIEVLEALVERVDTMIVGGAMAYTFLAAQGYEIGNSLVEHEKAGLARKLIKRCESKGVKLLLPVDHVVASSPEGEARVERYIPSGVAGFDIGPATVELFSEALEGAKTIFWNGPMGLVEVEAFSGGTEAIAKKIADGEAFSVIGGGDSAAAAKALDMESAFSHISTGGGASLEYIQGKKLPGIQAIERRAKR